MDTHNGNFDAYLFMSHDNWKLLQLLNYSQFLKVSNLDTDVLFEHNNLYHNKSVTYFPFGPSVSGLQNSIFYISELSLVLFSILRGEKASSQFFAESKHFYGYAEDLIRRLLKSVKIVPGLNKVMAEFLSEHFANDAAVKNTEIFRYSTGENWLSLINKAKIYLQKKQKEIYINLVNDCNNTAIYLPRITANEVARQIQRPFNRLAYIGTEKLYKKDLVLNFFGHIPPLVLDNFRLLKESGIMIHIFDFISSTSKPPPT